MSLENTKLMNIVLNGDERSVAPGLTLAALLVELNVNPQHVAIEVDREIVRRPAWDSTELYEGSKVEIVHFVGGG